MNLKTTPRLLVLFLTVAGSAVAHPGHGADSGLLSGLAHPLSGLDHLLAMLAVGIWAAQLGARASWSLPLAFLGAMAVAAALGQHLGFNAAIEPGIAVSVLLIGLMIASSARLSFAGSAGLVVAFALLHGFAHGTEMPATAAGFSYGLGFLVSTSLLLGGGVLAGRTLGRKFPRGTRVAGLAIAAAGVALLSA